MFFYHLNDLDGRGAHGRAQASCTFSTALFAAVCPYRHDGRVLFHVELNDFLWPLIVISSNESADAAVSRRGFRARRAWHSDFTFDYMAGATLAAIPSCCLYALAAVRGAGHC